MVSVVVGKLVTHSTIVVRQRVASVEVRRATGDSLIVLPEGAELQLVARGMDARIDDASAGWKGRALYSNYCTHFVWHIEGGKGTKGKIVKFQIRPDPLAR